MQAIVLQARARPTMSSGQCRRRNGNPSRGLGYVGQPSNLGGGGQAQAVLDMGFLTSLQVTKSPIRPPLRPACVSHPSSP